MNTDNESNDNTENMSSDILPNDDNTVNPIKESEFDRSVMETLGNKVRLTDNDADAELELYCYVRCGPTDSELLHQCRGVVFNKEKLIMQAFPYTIEHTQFDVDKIKEDVSFSSCKFYDSHEGSLIRMFYFNNKWYTSTHRKLNAFNSKWGSKESFGSSFKKALDYEMTVNKELSNAVPECGGSILERFQTTLDTEKQYMFIVRHSHEHRIVCTHPENPTVYHVGTFVNGKLVMTEDCNIPHPREHDFKSVDDILEYVSMVDIRNLQGVICFFPNNKQVKIVNNEYQEYFCARGNEPSIKFRYLQTRMNSRITEMLCKLYPNMLTVFDEIENSIYSIAKHIYQCYVQRFIKKKFVTVPVEEFSVIKACHLWHEENRIKNRISIQKIIEVLNSQNATNINRMIKRFNIEKNKTDISQYKIDSNKVSPLQVAINPIHNVPQINIVVS